MVCVQAAVKAASRTAEFCHHRRLAGGGRSHVPHQPCREVSEPVSIGEAPRMLSTQPLMPAATHALKLQAMMALLQLEPLEAYQR